MKSRFLNVFLAFSITFCFFAIPAAQARSPLFSDVPAGSWFEQGVTTCAGQGVMVGTGEDAFSPDGMLSQAQCLTLALRIYDLQQGGTGELEQAPEDWGKITLTLADGTAVEGYPEKDFGFSSFKRDAGADAHLYVPLSPAEQAWGKSVDARTATAALNGKTYQGLAQCWEPAHDGNWVISFYPGWEENSEISAFFQTPHPHPGVWYRNTAYTAEAWGLTDSQANPGLFELYRDLFSESWDICRYQFANALAEAAGPLPRRFPVNELPDVDRSAYPQVFALFEAGVLTGSDEYGTFGPYRSLTRAQAAVMAARVLDERQRVTAPPKAISYLNYTLTPVDLQGWEPLASQHGIAADWMPVTREDAGAPEYGIYREDGTIFTREMEGGRPSMSDAPGTLNDTLYAPVRKDPADPEGEPLMGLFDVSAGKLILPYGSYASYSAALAALSPAAPQPRQDGEEGLWGYVDADGQWTIPPRYFEAQPFREGFAVVCLNRNYPDMEYTLIDTRGEQVLGCYRFLHCQGGGLYYFDGIDGSRGLVSIEGGEQAVDREELWVMADLSFSAKGGILPFYALDYQGGRYYDYRMTPISQVFDWVGPLNDDLSGFVQKDGQVYRIRFTEQ